MATRPKREGSLGTQNDSLVTEADQGAANRLFLQRVELLPGILRVEQHEDAMSGEHSFRVYARRGDRNAQYGVYESEAEIYHRYPRAHLDVQVVAEEGAAATVPGRSAPTP